MEVLAIDFESYWDSEYSLTRLTPLEYVMDSRWEAHSLTVTAANGHSVTAIGDAEIRMVVRGISWSKYMVIGHNLSGFDAYVAALRYGIKPRMWGCTLAMARPHYARTVGLSLKALCNWFALGVKDDRILHATKGRKLADFSPTEISEMRRYNREDAVLCMRLFGKLAPMYDARELWQIDALIRMRTEPVFELNMQLLEQALVAEQLRQRQALSELAVMLDIEEPDTPAAVDKVRSKLMSPTKFSALLESRDVDVPMKPSPTDSDKMIPALAKTDREFLDLRDHADSVVAQAATLRLDVKSTLTQTRVEAFIKTGRLTGGKLPIPLAYCGAITTGRDSGEEFNPLNLPRIDKRNPKPSDALRNSIEAPEGKALVVVDFSGIELRVNHYLWQVTRTMRLFNECANADLYVANAQEQLGRMDVSPQERHIEKTKQLGLGFGAGAYTFQRVARAMDLQLTLVQAQDYVDHWRARHPEIAGKGGGWAQCNAALANMGAKCEPYWMDPWGMVKATPHGFRLPSGRLIHYPDLRQVEDGKWPDGRVKYTWIYGSGKRARRLTGPKADENIVQALARDIMCDAAIAIWQETGFRPALRVYDELVYVVPDGEADDLLVTCHRHMRRSPAWWSELVLWSEGTVEYCYGRCK